MSINVSPPIPRRHLLANTDTWTGAVVTIFGFSSTYLSTSFDSMSQTFPLIVSLIVAFCGLLILVRSISIKPKNTVSLYQLGIAALAVGYVIAWGLALTVGIGFALSTFLLVLGMLHLAGLRSVNHAVGIATTITFGIYSLFVLVLSIHLPASFLSFIAPGL